MNAVDKSLAEVVTTLNGQPVTRGELRNHFDTVADSSNWKNPISATILVRDEDHLKAIQTAVAFFTGSCLHVLNGPTPFNGWQRYQVTAKGYYEALGA